MIYKVNKSSVITYQLKDMNNEIIKRQFYEKVLQFTKNTIGEYIIEKILKTKNNKIFSNGKDIIIHLTIGSIKIL